jgi:hypothetical protein
MGITAEAASGQVSDNAGKAKTGIDDAISAAFDASEDGDLSALLESESPKGKVKVEPKETKAKTKAEPDENAGDDEAQGEDAAEPEVKAEDSEESTTLSAPKHWPEADKQAFAKMTREGQEIALKLAKNLEGGFTRKSQELSDKAKFADSVRGLFDDTTRQQLQVSGTDEVGYIRYLDSLQKFATQKPVEYVKWAMQNLRVTPEQLGISQAPPPTPPKDPAAAQDDEIARLLQDPKVAQLEAQVQNLLGIVTKEQQAKEQAANAQRANAINTLNTHIRGFREALDDSGQLQYPHFDTVKAHMGALMDTDPDLAKMPDGPDKLKAAYDMAVWARPDLRQTFIDSEAQKRVQETQKKKDAERAKKATSVKPAAGVVSTKPKTNSLDDALSQAMSKAGL